ncbi:MAG: hypothetical protein ACRDKY_11055, partial [Solirubrobacteraceae bacterium]
MRIFRTCSRLGIETVA